MLSQPKIPLPAGRFEFQDKLTNALNDGWIELTGHGEIHALPFFRGFHHLAKALTSMGSLGRLRAVTQDMMGDKVALDIQPGRSAQATFESQNVLVRHRLIDMASWLLGEWPHRFIQACKTSRQQCSRFNNDLQGNIPYWLWKVTEEHLSIRMWHWRKTHLPSDGMASYAHLGRLATSSKLNQAAKRLLFVRGHQELWEEPIKLAFAMKQQGLYSQNSEVSIIARHCPVLIAYAKATDFRRVAGAIVILTHKGRNRFHVDPALANTRSPPGDLAPRDKRAVPQTIEILITESDQGDADAQE